MWDPESTAESAATEPQLVTSVISLHTVYSVQWPAYSAWHHLGPRKLYIRFVNKRHRQAVSLQRGEGREAVTSLGENYYEFCQYC